MSYFDRWDVCSAYSLYATLYGGDGCGYETGIQCRLSALRFRASDSESRIEGLSENAKEIYGALVRRNQRQYVAYGRLRRRAPHVFPSWPGSYNVGRPEKYLRKLGIDPAVLWAVSP